MDIPLRWIATALAAAALVGLLGMQHATIAGLRADLAAEKGARAGDRADAERVARATGERYRLEEQRRAAAQQEAIDAAEKRTAQARADAAAAGAAADRLSRRVAALVAEARRAAENPPAAGASAPAADAAGVLAELQRRADERAGILARIADERGAAGEACERAYDALTAPPVRLRLGDPL